MDIKIARARIESAKREGKRYRSWAAVMTISNLFLVVGILFTLGNQRTILTNIATDKDYWISNTVASQDYIRDMASNFVSLTENIHPKIVLRQHEKFLRYVAPSRYGEMKTRMVLKANKIRKNALSQTFYEQNVVISKRSPNKAMVIGIRKIYYGNKLVSTVQARYLIIFKLENGRMFVQEYKELNKNEKPFA